MKRISLSRTEKGVLAKWTFILKENIYYVKTGRMEYGTFSNLEPISEVIATRVGKIILINSTSLNLNDNINIKEICEDLFSKNHISSDRIDIGAVLKRKYDFCFRQLIFFIEDN